MSDSKQSIEPFTDEEIDAAIFQAIESYKAREAKLVDALRFYANGKTQRNWEETYNSGVAISTLKELGIE